MFNESHSRLHSWKTGLLSQPIQTMLNTLLHWVLWMKLSDLMFTSSMKSQLSQSNTSKTGIHSIGGIYPWPNAFCSAHILLIFNNLWEINLLSGEWTQSVIIMATNQNMEARTSFKLGEGNLHVCSPIQSFNPPVLPRKLGDGQDIWQQGSAQASDT